MMLGVLGSIEDYDEAMAIVRQLVTALPSGSYLVINDGTNLVDPNGRTEATWLSREAGAPYIARHPDKIAAFFTGLDLVEPGVVSTTRWQPIVGSTEPPEVHVHCGVARIP